MGREDQQRMSDIDEQSPTLSALLRAVIDRVKKEVYVNLPGSVIAYDHTTETAQVLVSWLQIVRDFTIPTANAELPQPPAQYNMRVAWPDNGTGDGYRFPINPGTTGSIRVYDRSLDSWNLSPPGTPVDPVASWAHILQDSVFWPDIRPASVPVVPVTNPASHVIRASAQLQLGGDLAVEGAVKDLSLQTMLNTAATAASAAAVPNDGGAVAFSTFATSLLGLVTAAGSVKVKVEP